MLKLKIEIFFISMPKKFTIAKSFCLILTQFYSNLTFCPVSKNLHIKLRHLLTYMDLEQLIRLRINDLICEKVVKMSKIVNFFHLPSGVYEKSRTSRCAREL